MRPHKKLWLAASAALILLVSATAVALESTPTLGEALSISDLVSARVGTELEGAMNEAVAIGDYAAAAVHATASSPFTEVANIGDLVAITLLPPLKQALSDGVGTSDQIAATLVAALKSYLNEAIGINDQIAAQVISPIEQSLGEAVSVADNVGTSLVAGFKQALGETVSVSDQLTTNLVAAVEQSLAESVRFADQANATLGAALRPLQTEALSISDGASSLMMSGAAGSQVTTDGSGNTVVTGADASGGVLFQVALPPGTTTGPSVAMVYATSGANSMVQVTGATPPYPPGKTVTILNAAGVRSVCIVDRPDGATLQAAVCGATDISSSHVILACDGSQHTYGPFPTGPSARTYSCAQTSLSGQSYLRVSGLAFSTTIVDATTPTLTLPPDITAVLTSRAGAAVTFSTTANDPLDPNPSVSCSPRSGSIFPVGTTKVTCTATDAAGNVASGSLHVSIIYQFGGFLPPLQSGGTYSIGQTIPVKFQLVDANGHQVTFATGTVTAGPAAGFFRFQGNHYQFNLDTTGMKPGPVAIAVNLDDGKTYSIAINLTA